MNKQEAITALRNGQKVTHFLFDKDGWIESIGGGKMIRAENGYPVDSKTFWEDRKQPEWDDDWGLYPREKLISKGAMNRKFYAVEYAGFWHIQTEPYYGEPCILNADTVGEENAKKNANLIVELLNKHYDTSINGN